MRKEHTIHIRRYRVTDWSAVCRLIHRTTKRFLVRDQSKRTIDKLLKMFRVNDGEAKKQFSTKPVCGWVAEKDGRIVGVVSGIPRDRVKQLYVEAEFQGQGIGKRLLQRFCEQVKKQRRVWVRVDATPSAVSFYEHLGFKKTTGMKIAEDGVRYQPMRRRLLKRI